MLPLSAPFGNIHFLSEPEEKSGFANDLRCGKLKITYKLGTCPRIGEPWISRMRGSCWIGNSSAGGNQMNLHEEEWILTIAEMKSITRAAEKLFVSPSALTQMINKTEQELGTPIFLRSRKGCALTEAGMVYVEGIRSMLQLRRKTYAIINDMTEIKKTEISIGFPPEHGGHMFASIYPKLQQTFPNLHIRIRETSVRNQQEMIVNGDLDIGFLTLIDSQKTDDEYIPITTEELLIALPANAAPSQFSVSEPGSRFPVLDVSHLNNFPFAQMYSGSTFRAWTDELMENIGFNPHVIIETTRHSTLLRMVGTGLCGCLATDYHCHRAFSNPNISFFCLPSHPSWQVVASYRRGGYLSKPMKLIISLAQDYWRAK